MRAFHISLLAFLVCNSPEEGIRLCAFGVGNKVYCRVAAHWHLRGAPLPWPLRSYCQTVHLPYWICMF